MISEQHNPHPSHGHGESPLPKGYYEEWDGDFIWLRRPNGSVAGVFSDMGATEEGIAGCAWQDSHSREISTDDPQGRT